MNILEAIAKMEGFYKLGTRPQRLNNPGDLEYHTWMNQFGATSGDDPRFAKFPTPEFGFAAMKHLFGFSLYAGLTVGQALNKWAPPVENDTSSYTKNVCEWTGLTPETLLSDALAKV